MKNKGFTLMELLGVIVIIAILTIIVFPSITNSVKNSSDKTDKLTEKLIYNASDLFISNHINEFSKIEGRKYEIELKDLVDEGLLVSPIKYSDQDDITNNKCIEVTYDNGYKYEIKEKGTCEKTICQALSVQTEGGYTKGDVYECNVDPNSDPYIFYVLTSPSQESTTVDLIMNSNISNGTFAWNSNNDNNLGPVTALDNLKLLTDSWINLKKLNINTFNDSEGNTKQLQEYDMYARLPYKSEIDNSEFLYKIISNGYWTATSEYNTSNVYYVDQNGLSTTLPNTLKSIRPVIIVSKNTINSYNLIENKNLFDFERMGERILAWIKTDGKWESFNDSYSVRIPCRPNRTYTISFDDDVTNLISIFRAGYSVSEIIAENQQLYDVTRNTDATPITIETGEDAKYLVVQVNNANAADILLKMKVEQNL